jgi:hypothetical protein
MVPQVLNFFSNFHDQFEGFPLSEALLFTDGSFSKCIPGSYPLGI